MTTVEADIAAIARISAVPIILKVISETTGLRLALVARVTEGTWTACAVLDRMEFGLAVGDNLDVATTLCSEVRDTLAPVIIEHASAEPAFCTHPTPKMYGFESYIAVPLYRPGGEYFGTVCALDASPAPLREPRTVAMFTLFAEMISHQLSAEDERERERAALLDERHTAELREQFIAVLGHDLRNPLSSVVTGAEFLLDLEATPIQRTILERIHRSGSRMTRLIDDVLDFARGRLGGGMPIHPVEVDNLELLVRHVAAEVASAHPSREIRVSAGAPPVAWLDRTRVAQMLSNLVANAVEHSPEGQPVDVRVDATPDLLRFAVTSRGDVIPAETMARLFQPYVRGSGTRPRTGLGLGLYITSEIARAHGGAIHVASSVEAGTTFTAMIPRSLAG